jgi:hypothetical protein
MSTKKINHQRVKNLINKMMIFFLDDQLAGVDHESQLMLLTLLLKEPLVDGAEHVVILGSCTEHKWIHIMLM